ncbi:MAG TPA: ribose 5-phosphate isomerase B [Polyangia bacterium]|jgi:RpiB/LacA/LacB family sugar-phosphate isomerase|nr:ribose 5-phosphate isomerase B [Polyangia bacterium]
MVRKIYAGSDHAGFGLRRRLVEHLRGSGHLVEDLGPATDASCDYPQFAGAVARAVRDDAGAFGLLVCGTGLGVCIAANKIRGVRAVDAWNVEGAKQSRGHNDANVLCLGARLVPESDAVTIVDTWLATPFEAGRHARRVAQIAALEIEESRSPVDAQQK